MDKINNKKYGETPDNMTGTPNGAKTQNYGQTQNRESLKDRVVDKVDNAASKVADKVHEKASQFKSGTTDCSRSQQNGMKKPSENCGCGTSDKGHNVSGSEKPGQGKTSY